MELVIDATILFTGLIGKGVTKEIIFSKSLALNKCPIWSNDPHFKEQSLVRVFTTEELVEYLKSKNLL